MVKVKRALVVAVVIGSVAVAAATAEVDQAALEALVSRAADRGAVGRDVFPVRWHAV